MLLYLSFSKVPERITLTSHYLCKPSCSLVFPYLKQKVLANHHTCIHVEAANDSLKPGDTLNYTDTATVYSKKGKYSPAFGSPTGDDNHYLFVFNVNKNVQVWVSDGNQPVHKDSAVLSLNRSGVLQN